MPVPTPFILAALGLGAVALATKKKPTSVTAPDGSVVSVKKGQLPPEMKAMVDAVIIAMGVDPAGNVTGVVTAQALQAATQVAGELEAAGYIDDAARLRKIIQKATKHLPKTPVDKQIPLPGLSDELANKLRTALEIERDPAKLRLILASLEGLPNAKDPQIQLAIAQLKALIAQVEATQNEGRVIREVDKIVNPPAQGHVDIMPVGPKPVVTTGPQFPVTSPGQPIPGQKPPGQVTVPEVPSGIKIPSVPVPQPIPVSKGANAIAADALALHLLSLEKSLGFPKKAKGNEDKQLVKRFQTLEQITADGMIGPGVLLRMAQYTGLLPHVWYWPKGATGKNVEAYRASLLAESMRADASGDALRAQQLRESASRENGEGGVSGSVSKPPSVPSGPITVSPMPGVDIPLPGKPTPTPSPISQLTPIGKAAQAMFDNINALQVAAGNNLAKVKGKEDASLVRAFQSLAGKKPDGLPGPGTYLAAAEYSGAVPLVMYWPKNSNRSTVTAYRNEMENVAKRAESIGDPLRANAIRLNVVRDVGQGGIAETGPVVPGGKFTSNV